MEYFKEIKELIARKSDYQGDESKAATNLIRRLEKLCVELSKTDRYCLLDELNHLSQGGDIEELDGCDLDRACEITSELDHIEKTEIKIRADILSLVALNYLIKGYSREQIISELKNEKWHFKHEVLTRWCWSYAQRKAAQNGSIFNRIYLCEVGSIEGRRNLDREFFTYLKFMPYYQARSQQCYLLYKYNGVETHKSPDFISINDEGEQLGVEVTEVRKSIQREYGLDSERGYRGNEMEWETIEEVCGRIEKKISNQQPTVSPCLLVIYDNLGLIGSDYKKLGEVMKKKLKNAFQGHFKEIWLIDDKQGIQLG